MLDEAENCASRKMGEEKEEEEGENILAFRGRRERQRFARPRDSLLCLSPVLHTV